LTQIPISMFLDKLGAKRLMIALSFVGMAGAIMFSLAQGLGTDYGDTDAVTSLFKVVQGLGTGLL
jgi:hypothetical protein